MIFLLPGLYKLVISQRIEKGKKRLEMFRNIFFCAALLLS